MLRSLIPAIVLVGLSTTSALSFSESDFRRLRETGQCEGCDLRAADLTGLFLVGAKLRNANLAKARLTKAELSKADLRGANLTRANLQYANLEQATMEEAILRKADLTGVRLSGANLSGASLYKVDAGVYSRFEKMCRNPHKWGKALQYLKTHSEVVRLMNRSSRESD